MEFSASTAAAVVVCFLALISVSSRPSHMTELSGIDAENHQAVNVTPVLLDESVPSKEFLRCARVHVSGLSRLKLGRYSSARRITLVPSDEIQVKAYKKIHICLHSNSSLGLCRCESDYFESVQTGKWTSVISPYEDRYIDVKFVDNLSGFVTVSNKLEFQRWRLICLAIGLVLLLLAPIVSSWVPFYYSSSMAIGICLVVIILLFQVPLYSGACSSSAIKLSPLGLCSNLCMIATFITFTEKGKELLNYFVVSYILKMGMKLLPTGRKNALYSTICGLVLGAGSFLLNRFSMFVNSVFVNLGISQEMHNPVLIFCLVGVVLAGAGFGYWLVRKFVVAEDGTVDVSVSQFVKWALRVIAVTFIFQSTLDTLLALSLLAALVGIYLSLPHLKWGGRWVLTYSRDRTPLRERSARITENRRAEFLSRSAGRSLGRTPTPSPPWSRSPVRGLVTRSSRNGSSSNRLGTPSTPTEYYSTFHKTPNRKKFTEEEWRDFTEESTRQAVAELTSSPDFTDWIIQHADRIQLHREGSSDESIGSGSASTDENVALSSSGRGLLWQRRK